jgi:hypothetical protein
LNPTFHLTTGTFNLVVKDPIAFRLSGAFRYPGINSEAPRISFGASSEAGVSQGLSPSRDEPFENSANRRFLSTAELVIFVITLTNPQVSPLAALSGLCSTAKLTHGQKSLNHSLKDLFRSFEPFGNLSSRMLPAGPALGKFGGFSSDDPANEFDSTNRRLDPAARAGCSSPLLFGHFPLTSSMFIPKSDHSGKPHPAALKRRPYGRDLSCVLVLLNYYDRTQSVLFRDKIRGMLCLYSSRFVLLSEFSALL